MKVLLVHAPRRRPVRLERALSALVLVERAVDPVEVVWRCADPSVSVAVIVVDAGGAMEVALAQRIRAARCTTPVLVVAGRSTPADVVAALDAGADDYISKPFQLTEVVARIRALERRAVEARPAALVVGDVTLDALTREVRRGSTRVLLSPTLFHLLEAFLRRPGQVLTRDVLLELVWPGEREPRSNVVDQAVAALRRAVDIPFGTRSLETVRGVGYRWAAAPAG